MEEQNRAARIKQVFMSLQAFLMLFLCAGMAWMIFVMAGFNPNPPTALDIKMRSTQDLSYSNMNSTAAALAVQMLAELVPTAIVMPATATNWEILATSTLSFSLVPLAGWSQTPTASPTTVRVPFVPTRTKQPAPTRTPTRVNTSTPLPPATPTVAPSATPIPTTQIPPTPSATHARTATPKATQTPTPMTSYP